MEFIAANGYLILLLVVILLFFIYELYIKPQPEEEFPTFIELEESSEDIKIDYDKSLDKEVLEAVKIAIKIHREKAYE